MQHNAHNVRSRWEIDAEERICKSSRNHKQVLSKQTRIMGWEQSFEIEYTLQQCFIVEMRCIII